MSYASVENLIERFGLVEVKALAPSSSPAGYDEARLLQHLADASAELDTYLAARYTTPIDPVPGLLEKFTCDLAREALDRQGRANVIEAGKRARGWARDIAQGKATLGGDASGSGDGGEAPASSGGGIAVSAPDRIFTDETLRGFG